MEADFYSEEPSNLNINLDSRSFLQNTAKWGKFLAVVGFILVGLMVLGGVAGLAIGGNLGGGIVSGAFVGLLYLLFALVYLLPVLYLYKFSNKMKVGLAQENEEAITESFKNLKSLFKFMGILTIVIIGFYVLALLAITFGAAVGASI